MPSPRVFFTITAGDKVHKVLRERYQRDVQCGSVLCNNCEGARVLGSRPCSTNKLLPGIPHYVCIDPRLILTQSCVVLSPNMLADVIVPITTLEEVRSKSFLIYTSLKTLLLDPERRFYLFLDDFYCETAIEDENVEMSIDRRFRSCVSVVHFYRQHLSESHIEIVFLAADQQSRERAIQSNLISFTLTEYMSGLGKLDVCELLMQQHTQLKENIPENFTVDPYPAHLNMVDMIDRIHKGTIFQGVFRLSGYDFKEGTVTLGDGSLVPPQFTRFRVSGRININRAIDGDVVACELLQIEGGREEVSLEEVDQDDAETYPDEIQSLNITNEECLNDAGTTVELPLCRIVGIIRRKRTEYCGVVQGNSCSEYSHCLFIPVNRRIPKVRIETRQVEYLKTLKLAVCITRWPRSSRYPIGFYCRAVGNIGDRRTDSAVLLMEHDIPFYPFSNKVLKSLPPADFKITDATDLSGRVDLRSDDICLFSVDPPGCTDIDDALHCREMANGNLEVGVHIADVTYFVRPGSAVDEEARKRCTSVYLVDQRIDMLPHLLSSNLCSLREHTDRLAFSVVWEIVPSTAHIVDTRFHRSIIRSRASLEYGQAQMIINDASRQDKLATSLRQMNELARILRGKRMERGALTLESAEIRFVLDKEDGDPLEMLNKEIRDTNHLVEEFMLLANISVAKRIYSAFPNCACLRRHPTPSMDSFEPLLKAASSMNIDLDVTSGKALSAGLERANVTDNAYFNTMLRMLTTRCMTQAVYFCSGKLKESDFSHYGLASSIYTHFTSPIRRYADILVHRLLACSLHLDGMCNDPILFDAELMEPLCVLMNQRHRQAQQASRDSVHINALYFFRNRVCEEPGYILNVMRNALRVFVPRYGIEVTVNATNPAGKVCLTYNQEENMLHSVEGSVELRMFDRVVVQISTLEDPVTSRQRLQVFLVQPLVDGLSVPGTVSS